MYFLVSYVIVVGISLKAEIELKMTLRVQMKKERVEYSANDISNILSNVKFEISTLLIQILIQHS